MLDGAAAAAAEILAERRDPLRAGVLDPRPAAGGRDAPATGSTSTVSPPSVYGTNTVWPPAKRDAVAAMADMIDDEALNHGARR